MPASSLSPASSASAPFHPTRTVHLAAAIDGREPSEAAYYAQMARLAEDGALDFVTVGGDGCCTDPFAVLARVAPATDRIGLVPAVTAVGAEPVDLALAVATLDRVSQGRAGWTVTAPQDEPGGGPVGPGGRRGVARRRATGRAETRWRAAAETAEAVTRIWDAGETAPRPPQGRPVTAVDATEPAARVIAARHADLAFVRATRPELAGRVRTELRRLAAEAGRDPDRLLVLAELAIDLGGGELGPEPGVCVTPVPDGTGGVLFSGGPVDLAEFVVDWQQSGAVDGFHVRPVEPRRDLERFVNGTVALLQHRGLFRSFHPGATLREHLGLHRPVPRTPADRLASDRLADDHLAADRLASAGEAAS
ncbi:LLM class flavin-dependent oxidoreductase [Streptomyces sp.]|uniref:LLM class flavin-dependent oxidoreductase n=1 Tax=Streptomyces sp. TaxID=1931 RepID=UPI002F3E6748